MELTRDGRELLSKAEFALAFVEDHVFGALDNAQRETLYELLQLAARGGASCTDTPQDC